MSFYALLRILLGVATMLHRKYRLKNEDGLLSPSNFLRGGIAFAFPWFSLGLSALGEGVKFIKDVYADRQALKAARRSEDMKERVVGSKSAKTGKEMKAEPEMSLAGAERELAGCRAAQEDARREMERWSAKLDNPGGFLSQVYAQRRYVMAREIYEECCGRTDVAYSLLDTMKGGACVVAGNIPETPKPVMEELFDTLRRMGLADGVDLRTMAVVGGVDVRRMKAGDLAQIDVGFTDGRNVASTLFCGEVSGGRPVLYIPEDFHRTGPVLVPSEVSGRRWKSLQDGLTYSFAATREQKQELELGISRERRNGLRL